MKLAIAGDGVPGSKGLQNHGKPGPIAAVDPPVRAISYRGAAPGIVSGLNSFDDVRLSTL